MFMLSLLLSVTANDVAQTPQAVYLTWQRDPTTTMTVHWLDQTPQPTQVAYRLLGEKTWRTQTSSHEPMLATAMHIHTAELIGLEPHHEYEFRIEPYPEVRKFRTLSDDPLTPLRFAVGGDVYNQLDEVEKTNVQAARQDIDFVIWGGDLAYANAAPDRAIKWLDLLGNYTKTMVSPDGRSIPLLVVIGNHDLEAPGYDLTKKQAPYFYSLFAFPAPRGYGVLDVGDYLSIVLLDSGHTNPTDGEQKRWLAQTLQQRQQQNVTHVFAVYHVPVYPGARSPYTSQSRRLRKQWVAVFEKYGLDIGFENHDHAYKRTQPIKNNRVDSGGVVYIGDGGWGMARLRIPAQPGNGGWFSQRRWYLASSASLNHFVLVTIEGKQRTFQAINQAGEVFDEYIHIDGQPIPIEPTPYTPMILRGEVWIAILLGVGAVVYIRRHKRSAA